MNVLSIKGAHMKSGKFNVVLDQAWGSSGKGLMSTWLADHFNVKYISSSNYPNAGHTAIVNGNKFVAKAIPTAAILKKAKNADLKCFISPGSGYSWERLFQEWEEAGQPSMFIHDRASVVTEEHKKREFEGRESTKHVASTMQGTAAAICDKVLRKADVYLARTGHEGGDPVYSHAHWLMISNKDFVDFPINEACEKIKIVDAFEFRNLTHNIIKEGHIWLHEGSQGYALSIDHGSHYPNCTSRNCTVQAAMDHMAIPPHMVGDVYLNIRTISIRVGNVIENGKQVGYSGDFYPDCKELTWEEVAKNAGMPDSEIPNLIAREHTTVTKRIRRASNLSFIGLQDAVRVNGATKLCLNFMQYINWQDRNISGGKEAFEKLSKRSRDFINKIEETTNLPIVLIGTGPNHEDVISLL